MRNNQVEQALLSIVDGPCPDADFCIKMGGCMSGCTQGPGPKFPDDEEFCTLPTTPIELELAGTGLILIVEQHPVEAATS